MTDHRVKGMSRSCIVEHICLCAAVQENAGLFRFPLVTSDDWQELQHLAKAKWRLPHCGCTIGKVTLQECPAETWLIGGVMPCQLWDYSNNSLAAKPWDRIFCGLPFPIHMQSLLRNLGSLKFCS